MQARAVQLLLATVDPGSLDPIRLLTELREVCTTAAMGEALDALGDAVAKGPPPGTPQDLAVLGRVLAAPGLARPGSDLGFQIAAVHAVPCALWCFVRYGQGAPLRAVQAAVALGGDTDTVASMVGAMCGALHGPGWLPPDLVEDLENGVRGRDFAVGLARGLAGLDLGDDDIKP